MRRADQLEASILSHVEGLKQGPPNTEGVRQGAEPQASDSTGKKKKTRIRHILC